MPDVLGEEAKDQLAKQLLDKTSKGESISDELNSIPLDERLALARKMETMSKADSSIPDLELTVDKDFGGREHLKDIEVQGEWGNINNDKVFLDHDVFDNETGMIQDALRDTALQRVYATLRNSGDFPAGADGDLQMRQAVEHALDIKYGRAQAGENETPLQRAANEAVNQDELGTLGG